MSFPAPKIIWHQAPSTRKLTRDTENWELRQDKWSREILIKDWEENWSKFRDQTSCCHWNSVKDIQHGVEGKFFLRFIAVSYFCGSEDLMRMWQRKPSSEVSMLDNISFFIDCMMMTPHPCPNSNRQLIKFDRQNSGKNTQKLNYPNLFQYLEKVEVRWHLVSQCEIESVIYDESPPPPALSQVLTSRWSPSLSPHWPENINLIQKKVNGQIFYRYISLKISQPSIYLHFELSVKTKWH